MITDEHVLVVKNDLLSALRLRVPKGIITENLTAIYETIITGSSYLRRSIAENSRIFKQVIPYVIVTYKDKYLLFQRKEGQAEQRLHNKFSLGVGGHINPPEKRVSDVIMHGLYKEFNEELKLDGHSKPQLMGIINDDTIEVGKYHIGFLFKCQADSLNFILPEQEKMRADWADKSQLASHYNEMETWSQLYFDKFVEA